jgi:hypothetical protein
VDEAFVLHARQAAAEAQEGPPAGHVVEHGDLFRQAHGVVPGHDDDLGAETHALRADGQVGQVEQRVGADGVVREVVLGHPDGVEAQLVGQDQLGELLLDELGVGNPGMVGEAGGETHVHG